MIIQCTNCQTRFKLADDKMKPAGVKVRCTKCDEVFTALPPESQPAAVSRAAETPASAAPAKPAGAMSDTPDFSDLTFDEEQDRAPQADAGPGRIEADEFDFGEFNMEDLDGEEAQPARQGDEETFAAAKAAAAPETESSVDIPDFSLDAEQDDQEPGFGGVKEVEPGDLPPLEDFDLDEEFAGFDADETPSNTPTVTDDSSGEELSIGGDLGVTFEDDTSDESLPDIDRSALGTQEFSFDDSPDEPLAEKSDSEPAGPVEFAFDSDEDPFALPEEPTAEPAAQPETSTADEFIFEEPPRAEPSEPAAAEKTAATGGEQRRSLPPKKSEPARDKLPSKPPQRRSSRRPKTKRRKKSSGYRSVAIFLLLLLAAGGGYAYFGWQQGTYEPAILIERVKLLIQGQTTQDMTGQIDIADLRSQFVANQSAGELFVIHGNVVNNYSGARSTISVRGIIYDSSGNAILQQIAFCGNPLDEAALRTLPYAKIEETMNNQFGDSLSNLNLDAGQSLPFTIVFRNIPDRVAEFNVEVADSRPGTQ